MSLFSTHNSFDIVKRFFLKQKILQKVYLDIHLQRQIVISVEQLIDTVELIVEHLLLVGRIPLVKQLLLELQIGRIKPVFKLKQLLCILYCKTLTPPNALFVGHCLRSQRKSPVLYCRKGVGASVSFAKLDGA